MKRRIYAYISVLALASCAAPDYLAVALPRLEGRPVARALAYLGTPTEKKQEGGETVYTWIRDQSGSFYVPNTASYPVVVQNSGHPTVAFSRPATPSIANAYDWYCRLDITAKKGVIVHTAYEGNAGGCQTFSEKLKPLATKTDKK